LNLRALRSIASTGAAVDLFALDYNPVRLARSRRVDAGARLQQASLYGLPFGDGRFDLVLCNHVIEHIPDLPRALSELRRVLRPEGLLLVGVPNEGCLLARIRNGVLQRSIGRTTDHVHFFTAGTLTAALRKSGFRVQQIERETFFFPCSYVNAACNEFVLGHRLMAALRRVLPSQAGGLLIAAE
jgi:ubiquinone/menaquinone biosynthesis C-methylase UbiE